MPFFTIIVPNYNCEVLLPQCLDSIQNQTFTDWQCIVADDCSTDDSLRVVGGYLTDRRFQLMRTFQNGGPGAARTGALDFIRGKWVLFLDSDDYLDTNALERIKLRMEQTEYKHDIYAFNYRNVGMKRVLNEPKLKKGTFTDEEPPNFLVSWAKAYRADIILENELYFPSGIRRCEDVIFNQEYWAYAADCYCFPDILMNHRKWTQSITKSELTKEESFKIRDAHQQCIDKFPKKRKNFKHDMIGRLKRRIKRYWPDDEHWHFKEEIHD